MRYRTDRLLVAAMDVGGVAAAVMRRATGAPTATACTADVPVAQAVAASAAPLPAVLIDVKVKDSSVDIAGGDRAKSSELDGDADRASKDDEPPEFPLQSAEEAARATERTGARADIVDDASRSITFGGMPIASWRDTPGWREGKAYQFSLPRSQRYSDSGIPPLLTSFVPYDAEQDLSDACRARA